MIYFGNTDVGMKRLINQDYFQTIPLWGGEGILLTVCDGMGGHKAGDVASKTAVEKFCDTLFKIQPSPQPNQEAETKEIKYNLCHAVDVANNAVYSLSRANPDYAGMGTTLVAILVYKKKIYVINAGDSRCYLFSHAGYANQITKDHSYVQYMIDCGKLTPEEAKTHPRKNVITNAIGVVDKASVDIIILDRDGWKDSYLLLCSDGLSNYFDEKTLYEIIYPDSPDYVETVAGLSEKVTKLISHANNCGGADNITAVLCKLDGEEE